MFESFVPEQRQESFKFKCSFAILAQYFLIQENLRTGSWVFTHKYESSYGLRDLSRLHLMTANPRGISISFSK